jgi:hypothetical protein
MTVDESTGVLTYHLIPPPPWPPLTRARALAEFLPWRDNIVARWTARTGPAVSSTAFTS